MESLSRLRLYRDMLDREIYERQQIILEVNVRIYSGIEDLFLSIDDEPERKEIKDPAILNILRNNISNVSEVWSADKEIAKLINNLEKYVREYENKQENVRKNSRNLFNKIVRALGEYNSKPLIDGEMPLPEREKGNMPQVFLSHAYDDKLYSLALFEYFYRMGIYLYVDWMHHGKMDNGIELKRDLQKELNDSVQLLFLRTPNSELDIAGKQMLRSWCAWEIGNFYSYKNDEKYMLNLYAVESYKSISNIQLHGLKLYTGINNGLLDGKTIIP